MTTTRTTDEQAHVAAKLAPDQPQADRRGMTPAQRYALLNAIDVYGRTSRELMMASYEGRDAAEAQRACHDAYRRVLALTDEVTDYSAAEAVM